MPLGLMMSPSGVTKVPQKPFCCQREMPLPRFGMRRTSPKSSLTMARQSSWTVDLFDQRDRLPEMLMRREGRAGGVGPDLEGNEAPPAEGGALEIIDRPDAVRLVFHHDVLELLPEDRLDGRLVLPGHADVVGDEAQEELAGETPGGRPPCRRSSGI